ncbi:MAG: radical SAM protein [Phycisphaerae bacterium]|nr:radical SAM protein [Phycisphaerae bacterium]
MTASNIKQEMVRGLAAGTCLMYRVFNRCLGRSPQCTISEDARLVLQAMGVRPGTRAYARLKRGKQLLGAATQDDESLGGAGEAATLLLEGVSGFNVVYSHGRYYGWPQSAGGFSRRRFQMGVAPGAVEAESLAALRTAVEAHSGSPPAAQSDAAWATAAKIDSAARNVSRSQENIRFACEVVDNTPTVLIVSTAIGCNLHCRMCYLSSEHALSYKVMQGDRQMSEATFAKVRQLLPQVRDLIITVEGEILVHRHWVDRWFALMAEYPNLRLSLQTNGMLMNEEVVKQILACPRVTQVAFSVDGATSEVNDAIRTGARLDVILDGIRRLLAGRNARGRQVPNVHTHFVMMRDNIHELPADLHRMAELGVDSTSARHMIAYHKEQIAQSLYFDQARCDEMLRRARQVARDCGMAADLPKTFAESRPLVLADRPKCIEPWRHGQILHDGSVFSCCNNAVLMGNLNGPGGFQSVWDNDKYRRLRRTVNQPIPEFTLCKYCNAMLPVNLFEAHVYTKLLFELVRNGELQKYCPGPVELLARPDELIVE